VVIVPGTEDGIEERVPGQIIATIRAPRMPVDRRYHYFGDEARLHRAITDWQPDHLECSSPWASATMVAQWPGSAPRSLVMHADPLSAYAYRWFGGLASIETIDRGFDRFWRHLRTLDSQFDLIVSASDNFTRRLTAGGLTRVRTNPMGVEPGIFSPRLRDPAWRAETLASLALGPDALLLMGIGRYSPEKRWDLVIDAVMAAGQSRPIGLLLVGEGRARKRLEKRASGCPHIRIADAVGDRADLARMMASADGLVHGCEAETFCMVAAEARASGLPLIVPDRGGAADHALGPDDRLYAATDPDALRHVIRSFAPTRYDRGTPVVRTMDAHFDELFAAYGALVAAGRPLMLPSAAAVGHAPLG
jgi:alpha-1,6-mannosyltransferase